MYPHVFSNQPQQKKWHNKKDMYFLLLPVFLVAHLVVVSFLGGKKKQPAY